MVTAPNVAGPRYGLIGNRTVADGNESFPSYSTTQIERTGRADRYLSLQPSARLGIGAYPDGLPAPRVTGTRIVAYFSVKFLR